VEYCHITEWSAIHEFSQNILLMALKQYNLTTCKFMQKAGKHLLQKWYKTWTPSYRGNVKRKCWKDSL